MQNFYGVGSTPTRLWRKFNLPVTVGIVTGILFATSYPPFPAWALFFAFAPLWTYWFHTKTLKNVVVSGFVAQFTFTIIGFNWIAHTAIEYGHIPAILSLLILIGFCCFASLNVVIAGMIAWWVQRKSKFSPLCFFIFVAFTSGACDWFYPMIFPWNTAYPLLFSKLHSAQLAEFVGFSILSVLVYLANACFALAYTHYPRKGPSRPLLIFVIALFFCEVTGLQLEKRLRTEDRKISALLVQPNIGNYDKFVAERGNGYQGPVVQKDIAVAERGLVESSVSGAAAPDLMILPETAYPESLDPPFKNRFYVHQLQAYINMRRVPLLTGAYSEDGPEVREKRDYNALFAVIPGEDIGPGYRKQELLAFGEYFPGAQYFPFLKTLIPEISDFGRGAGPMAFKIAGANFLPLICYEGLDTQYVRKAVEAGGQIFVNVTNDSWFGKTFEPQQHMIMTVARTIEFRRPMVRVTNTGVTVVADQKGNILKRGPQDVEWAGLVTIPFLSDPSNTFFFLINPYISFIFLALVLIAFFMGRFSSGTSRT